MNKSLTDRVLGAAALNFVTRIAGTLVSLGSMAILGRLLGPSEYAMFSLLLLLLGFSGIAADALKNTILQDSNLNKNDLGLGILLVIFISTASIIVMNMLINYIGLIFGIQFSRADIIIISMCLFINPVTDYFDALQNKKFNFKRNSAIDFTTMNLLQSAMAIGLASKGFSHLSLTLAYVFSLSAKLLLQIMTGAASTVKSPKWNFHIFRSYLGFLSIGIFNYAGRNGDNAVIGALLGSSALAIYGRAFNLMMRPVSVFSGTVTSVFYPAIASLGAANDRAKRAYLTAIGMTALIALPLGVVGILFASQIVDVFLGPKWAATALPFSYLIAALYFRMAYRVTETVSFARRQFFPTLARQIFYSIIVMSGAAFGAREWGLGGAALMVAVSLAIYFFVSASFANRLLEVTAKDFALEHIPAILISLGLAMILLPLKFIEFDRTFYMLIAVVLVTTIYGMAVGFFYPKILFSFSYSGQQLYSFRKRIIGKVLRTG